MTTVGDGQRNEHVGDVSDEAYNLEQDLYCYSPRCCNL
jgi:hypothetical protein